MVPARRSNCFRESAECVGRAPRRIRIATFDLELELPRRSVVVDRRKVVAWACHCSRPSYRRRHRSRQRSRTSARFHGWLVGCQIWARLFPCGGRVPKPASLEIGGRPKSDIVSAVSRTTSQCVVRRVPGPGLEPGLPCGKGILSSSIPLDQETRRNTCTVRFGLSRPPIGTLAATSRCSLHAAASTRERVAARQPGGAERLAIGVRSPPSI